jgi:hypothetical protein
VPCTVALRGLAVLFDEHPAQDLALRRARDRAHCQLCSQALVVDRGWAPADYVERELAAIFAELIVPAGATNGPRA